MRELAPTRREAREYSRIAFDHWTAERAIDEMKAFHYRWVFLPHLQAYVERFPSRLNSEPAFVSLESANVY